MARNPVSSQVAYRPLYAQIRDLLRRRLVGGEWSPGTLLPSEIALAEEYGVSQGTLRKALDELAAERLVSRQQGRGTVVARHDPERSLFQFFHIHGSDGRRRLPESRLLGLRQFGASRDEAAALGLRPRTRVLRIERVRVLDERPALVETLTLPQSLFPGLGDTGEALPNALYELYQRRYGITVTRAREELRAVSATPREAELLGLAPGTPLLEIRRVAHDLQDRPVEWRRSRLDTRHCHYRNELD
ncbi:MAG: GntR family transcriptional regulator [Candidatus Competibacterales bacterium]|nr:GntR family transcriptional regulator [Candidatus Competibacterales bacterium]